MVCAGPGAAPDLQDEEHFLLRIQQVALTHVAEYSKQSCPFQFWERLALRLKACSFDLAIISA